MDEHRIARITYPTVSFTVSVQHVDWIARRSAELGLSKSEFVRRLLDADRSAPLVFPAREAVTKEKVPA